jgi:hypothetical protein
LAAFHAFSWRKYIPGFDQQLDNGIALALPIIVEFLVLTLTTHGGLSRNTFGARRKQRLRANLRRSAWICRRINALYSI